MNAGPYFQVLVPHDTAPCGSWPVLDGSWPVRTYKRTRPMIIVPPFGEPGRGALACHFALLDKGDE